MNGDDILKRVRNAMDVLVHVADGYEGLVPSLIDRSTHQMVTELPPAIDGQRMGDRSHLGCNLMHDHALLNAMMALEYGDAVDRYLTRFATHCTDTPTGLFPWGEHSFWHLVDDCVGNSYLLRGDGRKPPITHDHLRQAPVWLWEKLWTLNPNCVERFAEGLNGHWTEGEPLEYIRHAYIEEKRPYARGKRSCDFPRHGGMYILDWAFAYLKTRRTDFLDQLRVMMDYWWEKKDDLGLCLIESRSPKEEVKFYGINSVNQTLSLGVSLIESANMVADELPDLAQEMRARGMVYVNGFFNAPHDIEKGVFVSSCMRGTNEICRQYVVYGSKYGAAISAAAPALIALCGYRLTQDERFLDWTKAVAKPFLNASVASDMAVPAKDPAGAIALLADLYDVTGDGAWLDGGMNLAEHVMAVYMDGDVPRGSSQTEVYESQLGPGDLLYSLTRLALLANGESKSVLAPDYTRR